MLGPFLRNDPIYLMLNILRVERVGVRVGVREGCDSSDGVTGLMPVRAGMVT